MNSFKLVSVLKHTPSSTIEVHVGSNRNIFKKKVDTKRSLFCGNLPKFYFKLKNYLLSYGTYFEESMKINIHKIS